MFYLIAETTICICQTTFQPDRTSVYCYNHDWNTSSSTSTFTTLNNQHTTQGAKAYLTITFMANHVHAFDLIF